MTVPDILSPFVVGSVSHRYVLDSAVSLGSSTLAILIALKSEPPVLVLF